MCASMPTTKLWTIVALSVSAFAMMQFAHAQDAGTPPPKLEKMEEGEPPSVTIRKPESDKKITETRKQGKIKEVKVQRGKNTYYLKPNEPAGSALPGDAESSANRGAQWQVMEFGKPKPTKVVPQPPTLVPRATEPAASTTAQ
jgi:hypothetical protein